IRGAVFASVLNQDERETECFAQAFTTACRVQRLRLWSPLTVFKERRNKPKGALQGDEFQNSPVGCFERGEALQERASPCSVMCLYARGIIPRVITMSFVGGRTDKQRTKSLIWIAMLYAALL
ncbi:MAG: hypothetical protein IKW87_00055, partial [Ruminococcus sp.]|nr:hypothetical protein [Ruminococcus sp.]